MKPEKLEIRGETIYLKKDFLGWRIINPIKKDLDKPLSFKNINWFNLFLGGKKNLIALITMIFVFAMLLFSVNSMIKSCRDMAEHPCDYFGSLYCGDESPEYSGFMEWERMNPNINWSQFIPDNVSNG